MSDKYDSYKIPNKINISGIPFKVRVEHIPLEDGDTLLGKCETDKRLITISEALPDETDQVYRVVLHEALHAILGVSGISTLLHNDIEEALVLCLEAHIPGLIKCLAKGFGES